MIVGEKGAGKTLLLFKLIQDLKTLKDFNYNIVHINLADIINESKSEARKQFFNAF
jgi:ABC-type phosphate/phosphonate transport system ATPase subunit